MLLYLSRRDSSINKERTVSDFSQSPPARLPEELDLEPPSVRLQSMARRRNSNSSRSTPPPPPPPVDFQIGNCKVEVQGSKFNCKSSSNDNTLEISVSNDAKIKIHVKEEGNALFGNYSFLLINPKDIDSRSKSPLQEVLRIYAKELPAMNYAANTGKESRFLEKCVLNGKYCTLLLQSNATDAPRVVLAAVTYQIIPVDTQYAEIPLAAVISDYQHKGIGNLLYLELSKRLQNIGIRTIFCWGDKESEGFWSRQGFIPIAEVDSKGKARRLPIKADIRRALCFPGGSTLMVSHLNKDISIPLNRSNNSILCLPLKAHINSPESITAKGQELDGSGKFDNIQNNSSFQEGAMLNVIFPQIENTRPQVLAKDESLIDDGLSPRNNPIQDCENLGCWNGVDSKDKEIGLGVAEEDCVDRKSCSCSSQGVKKRVWEASQSSLKSKKVKGCHHADCQLDSSWDHSFEHDQANNSCFDAISLGTSRDNSHAEVHTCSNKHHDQELTQKGESHRIMLMNIADDAKKASLTKIIEGLGGVVASEGSVSTHVITGKARRTLNFCTALCSGAWIISASWLKASFREGKFVGELPFLLQDEEYLLKYSSELKDAVLRAKAHPQALLEGYDIILTKHVEPPVSILSAIVKSAGGNVLRGLSKVHSPSKTIFIACEEDMEEAMIAVKREIWTYNSDWFMNCVMKQELDLQAPQFAVSLS